MRNWVALCALCWPLLGFSADKQNLTVDAREAEFTVALPANPTTGYQWVVQQYDTRYFEKPVGHYVSANSTRMGAGGKTVFVVVRKQGATYPKCSRMLFRYARVWEPKSGVVTQVTVTFTPSSVHQAH